METKNVWVAWPSVSVERSRACDQRWRHAGYKTAVLMDGLNDPSMVGCDAFVHLKCWEGFPKAANQLLRSVPGDVVVLIGDDIHPDPNHSPVELLERFLKQFPDTYGVASPTGDKYGCSEIACISPWIGRKFINNAYDGQGPYWEEYFHYYSDAELQAYAEKQGGFTKWPDVNQYHDHWQRRNENRPQYLEGALKNHPQDKGLFERRKRLGFPFQLKSKEVLSQREAWKKFYETHTGKIESGSGLGSSLNNTKEIRQALPLLFDKYNICTMADIPCGDWNWMKQVNLTGVEYTGYDVLPDLIEINRRKYPQVKFKTADITNEIIDTVDLVLCRDLFFHFSNEWILKALKNLKASKSRWLLTTSFPHIPRNKDLMLSSMVGWRPINLTKLPFNFPPPEEVIQENQSEACKGRIVGLWDLKGILS